MVAEYLRDTYPNDIAFMRLRLGTLEPAGGLAGLTEEEIRALGVFRRWADAVVVTPAEVVLIEVSIRSDTGDPSKLVIYGRLARHTPELQEYLDRPLVLELVVAVEDPVVSQLAHELGIRTRVYTPPWLSEYQSMLHRRETRPTQVRGLSVPGSPAE
jgi:hypothetical protein